MTFEGRFQVGFQIRFQVCFQNTKSFDFCTYFWHFFNLENLQDYITSSHISQKCVIRSEGKSWLRRCSCTFWAMFTYILDFRLLGKKKLFQLNKSKSFGSLMLLLNSKSKFFCYVKLLSQSPYLERTSLSFFCHVTCYLFQQFFCSCFSFFVCTHSNFWVWWQKSVFWCS